MQKLGIYTIILSLFSFSVCAQKGLKIDNGRYVYRNTMNINNQFDTTFLIQLHKLNNKNYEKAKRILFQKIKESEDTKQLISKDPNYFVNLKKKLNSDTLKTLIAFNRYSIDLKTASGLHFYFFYHKDWERLMKQVKTDESEGKKGSTLQWFPIDFIPNNHGPICLSAYDYYLSAYRIYSSRKIGDLFPDGKYVSYYEPIYQYNKQKFITKKPFCYFEAKNQKWNGKSVYFSPLGDTIAKGNYVDGKQDGKWMMKFPFERVPKGQQFHFCGITTAAGKIFCEKHPINAPRCNRIKTIQGKKEKGWCTYKVGFDHGKLNGIYRLYLNGHLVADGTIKENKPVGTWKYYYENGQLATSFTLRDKPIIINKPDKIYPLMPDNQVCNSDTSVCKAIFPMGNVTTKFLGLSQFIYDPFEPINVLDSGLLKKKSLNSRGFYRLDLDNHVHTAIKGLFQSYYKNGVPYFKMKVNDSGQVTYFSPRVYDEHKNVIQEWKFNKDRSVARVTYYPNDKEKKRVYKIFYHWGRQKKIRIK